LFYLADLDKLNFQAIVAERSFKIHCTTKPAGLMTRFDLQLQGRRSAIQLLEIPNLENLIERLVELHPQMKLRNNELAAKCDWLNIKSYHPQMLELARRYFGDRDHLASFMILFQPLFIRDRRLIWNANKTQLNSMKRLRLLCRPRILPLVTAMEGVAPFSGIVSFPGRHNLVKTMIILKNLQTIGYLRELEPYCFRPTL
jgi:hypothetical protein